MPLPPKRCLNLDCYKNRVCVCVCLCVQALAINFHNCLARVRFEANLMLYGENKFGRFPFIGRIFSHISALICFIFRGYLNTCNLCTCVRCEFRIPMELQYSFPSINFAIRP